ncbi:MAG: hypothetical protein JWL75_374 [Parcubacteria group bacterium]|nr:hypothetical protein [Parcubacteria group bacterium]
MKERILSQIKKGDIVVRSKQYLYVRMVGTAALAILALGFSILICNFIFFSLFAEHRAPLLGYGPPGYVLFIQFFPWPLLIADIMLLVFLRYLLRTFQFTYRNPLLYFVIGFLVLVGFGGILVNQTTGFNRRVEFEAHRGHLPPPVGRFFDDAHRAPPARPW